MALNRLPLGDLTADHAEETFDLRALLVRQGGIAIDENLHLVCGARVDLGPIVIGQAADEPILDRLSLRGHQPAAALVVAAFGAVTTAGSASAATGCQVTYAVTSQWSGAASGESSSAAPAMKSEIVASMGMPLPEIMMPDWPVARKVAAAPAAASARVIARAVYFLPSAQSVPTVSTRRPVRLRPVAQPLPMS